MDNHQYEAIKIAARVLRLRSGRASTFVDAEIL